MKKYKDIGIYDFSDYAEEIRSNPQAYAYYMAKQAEGAWGLNTETDIKSYRELTAGNIIDSINSSTTYYAIDHIKDLPNMENCNTALYNTVFFEFMKN